MLHSIFMEKSKPPLTLPGRPGYLLDWHDEFDYSGPPDSDKWDYELGLVRNNELQDYRKENAYSNNGALVIEGRKLQDACKNPRMRGNYTSASLITKNKKHFKFGIIQVRAKAPSDLGMWPAIWLMGAKDPWWWPVCGEVDIMEMYREGPAADRSTPINLNANWCWKSNRPDEWDPEWDMKKLDLARWTSERAANPAEWFSKFHLWELFWDETTMTISIDGEALNTLGAGTALENPKPGEGYANNHFPAEAFVEQPFLQEHYLLLSLAIGGNHGGTPDDQNVWPMKFEIDYVRYYRKQ